MLSNIFLTVLCLGILAVQAKSKLHDKPQFRDQFDGIVRDLEELNRDVSTQKQDAIVKIEGERTNIAEISANILYVLGNDLQRESAQFLLNISGLQERAYELGVDISACVGNSLDEITNLSNQLLGEATQCLNLGYAQALQAVEEGARVIADAVAKIDEYWSEVDSCRSERPSEQNICVDRIEREIRNDRVQIPANINSAVQDVLRIVETEKLGLYQCSERKLAKFGQEGGFIVRTVTECAERTFPPQPTPFK